MTSEEFTALNRELYAAGYPVVISNLPPPGLADLPPGEQIGWLFSQNYDIAQVTGSRSVIWLRTEAGLTPAAIVPEALMARLADSPASQEDGTTPGPDRAFPPDAVVIRRTRHGWSAFSGDNITGGKDGLISSSDCPGALAEYILTLEPGEIIIQPGQEN